MSTISKQESTIEALKPWIASVILLPIMIYFILNEGKFTLIDYVNLLIHEGGHGIFKVFGRFVHAIGGTLAQIIIPGMFVVFYVIHRKRIPTQIFLIWLGQNLMNIAVYAADARAHKLPLLGGNKVYHDWTYLLRTTGLLSYNIEVGKVFYWLGVGIFIISFFMPLFMRDYNLAKSELDL